MCVTQGCWDGSNTCCRDVLLSFLETLWWSPLRYWISSTMVASLAPCFQACNQTLDTQCTRQWDTLTPEEVSHTPNNRTNLRHTLEFKSVRPRFPDLQNTNILSRTLSVWNDARAGNLRWRFTLCMVWAGQPFFPALHSRGSGWLTTLPSCNSSQTSFIKPRTFPLT